MEKIKQARVSSSDSVSSLFFFYLHQKMFHVTSSSYKRHSCSYKAKESFFMVQKVAQQKMIQKCNEDHVLSGLLWLAEMKRPMKTLLMLPSHKEQKHIQSYFYLNFFY